MTNTGAYAIKPAVEETSVCTAFEYSVHSSVEMDCPEVDQKAN
jgi:hypothetical protein